MPASRTMTTLLLVGAFAMVMVSGAEAKDVKMLYFYKTGCHWCEKVDEVLRDRDVAVILQRYTDIISVDIEKSKTRKIKEIDMKCIVPIKQKEMQNKKENLLTNSCSITESNWKMVSNFIDMFAVHSVPTIIFLDNAGKLLLRIPGFLSKDDFLSVLCNNVPGITGCGQRSVSQFSGQTELNQ